MHTTLKMLCALALEEFTDRHENRGSPCAKAYGLSEEVSKTRGRLWSTVEYFMSDVYFKTCSDDLMFSCILISISTITFG
jgi:hypothetical protein